MASDAPEDLDKAGYNDSEWQAASLFSARDVPPKGGYDRMDWDGAARLIWGPDLEADNTILCRATVE